VKFTVIWLTSAEAELAEVWLAADDRELIAQTANEIDARLAAEPETQGESRSGQRRILLVAPLGVVFETHLADRIVRVLDVWRFKSHH
jgi:hypothetical protein